MQEYVKNPKFNLEHLHGISSIAENLGSWVIAMEKFYSVNLIVKPKKIALAEANAKYGEIEGKLKIKQAELKVVQDKVDKKKRGVTNSLAAYEGIIPDAPSNSFKTKRSKGKGGGDGGRGHDSPAVKKQGKKSSSPAAKKHRK